MRLFELIKLNTPKPHTVLFPKSRFISYFVQFHGGSELEMEEVADYLRMAFRMCFYVQSLFAWLVEQPEMKPIRPRQGHVGAANQCGSLVHQVLGQQLPVAIGLRGHILGCTVRSAAAYTNGGQALIAHGVLK